MTAQPHAPDRRSELIEAALSIIAEHGAAETTVGRICDAAGVSRGLISHYFAGKEALLLETYRRLSEELATETAKAMKERDGDPVDALRALVEVSFRPPVHAGVTRQDATYYTLGGRSSEPNELTVCTSRMAPLI